MGHVYADVELGNPRRPDLTAVRVRALADTGALMLCIPEHVALQLSLEPESMREVSVADGRKMRVPYVGPLKVTFGQRFCYVGALVLGDEVLLGAVPMEDMDLVVNPVCREVTVDPASPNLPRARVKQARTGERRNQRTRTRPVAPGSLRSAATPPRGLPVVTPVSVTAGQLAASPDGASLAKLVMKTLWAASPSPRCSSPSTAARSPCSMASIARRSPGKTLL